MWAHVFSFLEKMSGPWTVSARQEELGAEGKGLPQSTLPTPPGPLGPRAQLQYAWGFFAGLGMVPAGFQ